MPKATSSQQPLPPASIFGSREELEQLLIRQIERGQQLLARSISSKQELDQAEADLDRWSAYNRELLLRSFDNPSVADEYSRYFGGFGVFDPSLERMIREYQESVTDKINRLQSIIERLELFPVRSVAPSAPVSTPKAVEQSYKRDVFIVHGHDIAAKEAVARFLMKLGLKPIILAEEPNRGRTIIEKLEGSSTVGFAVILLTGDDVGAAKADHANLKPRARQNTVLELGYFVAKLGRERVCALYQAGVELPSDYHGVAYVSLDDANGWQLLLAKEIKASGLDVDLNKAI